jgi:transcriptional regulator with GAF, ATPase, and Fis domain
VIPLEQSLSARTIRTRDVAFLDAGDLHEEISPPPSESDGTLRDREREHIIEILRQTRGALSGPAGTAALLGLKRTTLQYKMQRLGISRTDYLS